MDDMPVDEEFSPDPEKITVHGRVIFNPWVNISASLILTEGWGG